MSFPERCTDGALDCYACHPENFRRINGRWIYVAEMTDEEFDALMDDDGGADYYRDKRRDDELYNAH
jgi:hypothetical protein